MEFNEEAYTELTHSLSLDAQLELASKLIKGVADADLKRPIAPAMTQAQLRVLNYYLAEAYRQRIENYNDAQADVISIAKAGTNKLVLETRITLLQQLIKDFTPTTKK